MRVPLGRGDYERSFARAAALKFINRFYELSPQNRTDQVALISRPGSTFHSELGGGPVIATFSSPGIFGGNLFVVSGDTVFSLDKFGSVEAVDQEKLLLGAESAEIVGVRGAGFEYLFVSDGSRLFLIEAVPAGGGAGGAPGSYSSVLSYTPLNAIQVQLWTAGTNAGSGEAIKIDDKIYIPVIVPGPVALNNAALDGSPGNAFETGYRVNIGTTNLGAAAWETWLTNLEKAVNDSGVAGTDYSDTITTPNARAQATVNGSGVSTTLTVSNRIAGVPDPPIRAQYYFKQWVAPKKNFSSFPYLVGGGGEDVGGDASELEISLITTPDDFSPGALATLASFVLIHKAGSQRVYFIRPGNVTIGALDFFEAEGNTDDLVDMVVAGDQVWLMGQKSIEPWFLAAVLDPIASPFEPAKGQAVSIGVIPGTVVNHDGTVYFGGNDQNVYELAGGLRQISNPSISERIRLALRAQEED